MSYITKDEALESFAQDESVDYFEWNCVNSEFIPSVYQIWHDSDFVSFVGDGSPAGPGTGGGTGSGTGSGSSGGSSKSPGSSDPNSSNWPFFSSLYLRRRIVSAIYSQKCFIEPQ